MLTDGLYVAYMKNESDMDFVKVMLMSESPNTLPCQLIRRRPNQVSA